MLAREVVFVEHSLRYRLLRNLLQYLSYNLYPLRSKEMLAQELAANR